MDRNQKQLGYNALLKLIEKKIETVETEIALSNESMGDFCKSSAGDKHETTRAMAHIELDKKQQQLELNSRLKTVLLSIDLPKKFATVDVGSYVITSNGDFFISIPLGSIKTDSGNFYAISLASPIGQKLKGKRVGDAIEINGNSFTVEHIL